MIVYISGRITNNENYQDDFEQAELWLKEKGHDVINPAKVGESLGFFTQQQFMKLSFSLIDCADCVFMLHGWQNSKGANAEMSYARAMGKQVKYQDYFGRK